jgi:hypothetical protein
MQILKTAEQYQYLAAVFFLVVFSSCSPDYGDLIRSQEDLPPAIFVFLNTAKDSQYVSMISRRRAFMIAAAKRG